MARKRARHSLGKVERHKVERWVARRLNAAITSARVQHVSSRNPGDAIAVAQELADMLVEFQEKSEG